LVRGSDFQSKREFQAAVFSKFRSSVHHPSSNLRGAFHLLAVFRRYTFWLTESTVSLALHACLGGTPAGFHVQSVQGKHFRFSVASKHVGFLVCDLKRIITPHFDVYFHLLREGGPNWKLEHRRWSQEEDDA
jgi:hypothetical protein